MFKALNVPIDEFIRPFFDAEETICLRIFDDRKDSAFRGAKPECKAGAIAQMEHQLHEHNAMNRGIFFTVNFGGHEDADITRINAQFVECDTLSFDEQLAQIEAFSIEPSIIVKTRKSLHTYWLMKHAEVDKFRYVQKQLIAQFGGDKSCINESRVMRLPGFYHCKNEPVMVECVKFNPELRYTQAQLSAILPTVPEAPSTPVMQAKGTRRGLALVESRCDFIAHCKENAATLSEHDWYAMITNLAVFEGGESLIHALSRQYPKYNMRETQDKIRHYLESGTKPITCKTIAEKGFVCPKLGTQECACKAPAALCYHPMTTEELRLELSNLPVSKAATEDMQTAMDFIRRAVFNIDPVVAATFIDFEVKEHFGMKTGMMKNLVSMQKELYRDYRSNKDTRRETADVALPDWYEPTEKSGLRFIPGYLANHMASEVAAFYGAGAYYFYANGVYSMQEDITASAKARSFMIPRYTTLNQIADAVGQWRMQILRPVREINCNPFIVNLRNGLYNVLDDSFKAHTPEYISTVQISATYDPDAKCPQFVAFLRQILGDSEVPLIQEMLGYFLIPINKAQKSFVMVGAANAGKSTLLNVVQEILLGSENVSNIPWQNLADRFNKAELFGKLANIFADLPTRNIDDSGMFKAITGEDYITAERKNKDPFSFRPYARLLFSCNDIPRNYGDRSDGFYRRLIIIRFNKSIPKEQRDPNLADKLAQERNGILMWALDGLKRLIANSYQFSETNATRAELDRYRIESNSVLSFVHEFCELSDDKFTIRDELFTRYREYCGNAGMKPVSQTNFNKEIQNNLQTVTRGQDKLSGRRVWRGIVFHEGGNDGQ
ncbi:MAG: phage/plasmid primase, P4 family [Ruthenibacterium sp.]